jgi:N-acylneuraminate cytidylyltransferase
MIDGKSVLALVPARGGSKAIRLKNIQLCGGSPLIEWTLQAAVGSKYIDRVLVSSDSKKIREVAAQTPGVLAVNRPTGLAEDDTPMAPVIMDALKWQPECDVCVLLQPTSPLRTAADIDGALELLVNSNAKTVVSVYESWSVPFTGEDPPRRQDRKPTLLLNGAVYAFDVARFKETGALIDKDTVPYVMPAERSCDVDVPRDLALASLLIGGEAEDP